MVVPDRSYEQVLADPQLADLVRSGGLALVTTSGRADRAARTAVNLGAGRSAEDAPPGPVPFETRADGLVVDTAAYREVAGDATPGLLGSALSDGGLTAGYVDPWNDAGSIAMLTAMDGEGEVPSAFLGPSTTDATALPDAAAVILDEADLVVSPDPRLLPLALETTGAEEVLVAVVGTGASEEMRERGDTVGPLVLARGAPEDLLASGGASTGLTSSTTRREGIVSDVDLAPTILEFLGAPTPSEMTGSPIRSTGEPPTELYERALDRAEVVGPVGAALLWFGVFTLALSVVVVFVVRDPAPWLAGVAGLAVLATVALLVATTPASVVPAFTVAAVVTSLVVVAAALVILALRSGRGDPSMAVITVAVAGLVVVVVDRILGWQSQLTPMLGGSVLDGERFYGLGNAHAGFVLAGTVLAAARLTTPAGVGLIAAGAAFAGLPFLGADLGGSLALALTAALWFGVRTWQSLGWRTWALAAATLVATLLLLVVADRLLPGGGTHVSSVGDGGALSAFLERLEANVRTTSGDPHAWLALLGLPVWIAVAFLRPERIRPTLEPDEAWRDATIVLAIGGIAGWLLNDTYGMSGSAFAYVSAAMLYPTLAFLSGSRTGIRRTTTRVLPG